MPVAKVGDVPSLGVACTMKMHQHEPAMSQSQLSLAAARGWMRRRDVHNSDIVGSSPPFGRLNERLRIDDQGRQAETLDRAAGFSLRTCVKDNP